MTDTPARKIKIRDAYVQINKVGTTKDNESIAKLFLKDSAGEDAFVKCSDLEKALQIAQYEKDIVNHAKNNSFFEDASKYFDEDTIGYIRGVLQGKYHLEDKRLLKRTTPKLKEKDRGIHGNRYAVHTPYKMF